MPKREFNPLQLQRRQADTQHQRGLFDLEATHTLLEGRV